MITEEPPYEYCALRFAIQWERDERPLYEELSRNLSTKAVRRALSYFRVARGFVGLDEKADKIVRALGESSKHLSERNVVDRVTRLAEFFDREFDSKNLSAASKLLWLRCRYPVVILDSRTVAALKNYGHKIRQGDYKSFYCAWRDEFGNRQAALQRATEKLEKLKSFTASWRKSSKEFRSEINSAWFSERTFDLFLWELGNKELTRRSSRRAKQPRAA